MAPPVPEAADTFLAAIDRGDSAALGSVLAPDFTFEEVAGPGARSITALEDELSMIRAGFPDISYRPVRREAEGDRTYIEFKAIGTHSGEFLGIPATGVPAIVSGVFNLQCDEHSVRCLRLTVDFGGLRRQLLTAQRASSRAT